MFGKDKKSGDNASPSVEKLTQALGAIMDPAMGRDLASLGAIKEVTLTDQAVRVALELHMWSHPQRSQLEQEVAAVLASQAPGLRADVHVGAEVRAAGGAMWNKKGIPGIKNVVLVASGKGGVGKSTVASNLAVALAKDGAAVGLLDADVYGPSVPTMFGLSGGVRPGSPDGKHIEALSRYGIKLMSMGFMVDEGTPMVWRGPMIASACMQLFHDVLWGDLDYLVVDLPPGTGDIQLSIAQQVAVAGVVVVSTPQDVALADVIRAKSMFDKVGIPSLGLVENMSFFICDGCSKRHEIFDHGGAERSAKRLDMPFLGALPLETGVRKGGDEGTPVVIRNPESAAAQAVCDAAAQVATRLAIMAVDAPREEPPPPQEPKKNPLLRVVS